MPFIDDVLKCKSVSIVGLEKNTGKTECLNYVIKRLQSSNTPIAITSIGIDGEDTDQVYQTPKPEIEIADGTVFVTSEKHYKKRQLVSEIINISEHYTSLGRLVTARARSSGKVLLSGPGSTVWLQSLLKELQQLRIQLTLVDGALSRLSLASPTVTDGMILNTGAALSANISQLVKRTTFVHTLIQLEEINHALKVKISSIEKGLWAIDHEAEVHDLDIPSVFSINSQTEDVFRFGTTFFVAGAISDGFLNFLRIQKQAKDITLIIRDFTKAFVSEEVYLSFIRKGAQIKVLQKTKLIALCVNPTSPNGIHLNSLELRTMMHESLQIPVYDLRMLDV